MAGGHRGAGKFIETRDTKFRNARFKLIPAVAKGPWVVQKSVGTTPLIVGGALKVRKGVVCSQLSSRSICWRALVMPLLFTRGKIDFA
jgi:hypothetical protein